MPDYTPEQLKTLYDKLPNELKEAVFSKEIAQDLYDICMKYGLFEQEKISALSKHVGYVFLGILPPQEIAKTLVKELGLKNDLAKMVNLEIHELVLYPLKSNLEALYGPFKAPEEKAENKEAENEETPMPEEEITVKKTKGKSRKDLYREIIE